MDQNKTTNRNVRNGITWVQRPDISFSFEIETGKMSHLLPKSIVPFEVSPGISIMALTVTKFQHRELSRFGTFVTANWTVLVLQEDIDSIPAGDFNMFVMNVCSSYKPYVDYASEVDLLPIYHKPSLEIDCDNIPGLLDVKDKDGPICQLHTSLDGNDRYEKKIIWGRSIILKNGNVYVQPWKHEGYSIMYNYQKAKKIGTIFNHPDFFKGLDMDDIGDNCRMQFFADPKKESYITYYEPLLVRKV